MNRERLGDETLDWLERILASPAFERMQLMVVIAAALYFTVAFIVRHS